VDQSWGKVQVNSGARRAVVWPASPPAAAPAEVGETISSFVRRLIASAVTRLKSGERTLWGFTRKMDAGRMNSSFLDSPVHHKSDFRPEINQRNPKQEGVRTHANQDHVTR
jgi:hypothetical protein